MSKPESSATIREEMAGPLWAEVGYEIASIVDDDPDGAYLFVFVSKKGAGGTIYLGREKTVQCFRPSDDLLDLVRQVWEIHGAGRSKRDTWIYAEYTVTRRKFSVSLKYPEDVMKGTAELDWQERAVRARYGNKPIIQLEARAIS